MRYLGALAAAVMVMAAAHPLAAQHEDIEIFSSANGSGALVASYDFGPPIVVADSLGFCPGGMCRYVNTNPGFITPGTDTGGLFALDAGTSVSIEVVAIDAGASIKIGSSILDAPGESASLGTALGLHSHPEWTLILPVGVTGDYDVRFKLTTTSPSYAMSSPYDVVLTNVAAPTPTRTSTRTNTPSVPPPPTATPPPTTTPTHTATPAPATPTPSETATPVPTATLDLVCPPAPVAGCRGQTAPGSGLLMLKRNGTPSGNNLLWKWLKGEATLRDDFGDPTTLTSYRLCIYDTMAASPERVSHAVIPAGGTCAGAPCWKATASGYKYKDKTSGNSGVQRVLLKAGAAGTAKIIVKGKGALLDMPTLPLQQDSTVTVQIANGNACWEAVYTTPATVTTDERFKDKNE